MQMARRSLVTGLSSLAALWWLEGRALAAPRQTFFAKIGQPIGLQIYTLGDEAGRDIDATFAQVAAIGYREIELPNLYGRKPADIRAAADRAGLAIRSIHIPAQGSGSGSLNGAPAGGAEM